MSKAKFFKMAEEAGIEVEYTPGGKGRGIYASQYPATPYSCMCDAPHGKLFKEEQLHCTGRIQGDTGTTKTDWNEACKMMEELIAEGFEDCTDPDCDMCHPDEE